MSRLILLLVIILAASCAEQGTNVTRSTPNVPHLQPIPTPTEFPMGSGQPAPVRDSLALIRSAGTDNVAGAALVITSDGFLLTVTANLGKKPEIVLPNGHAVPPIRVASDPDTGLTLLKVSADHLVPVQLGLERIDPGTQVFAEGFDETTASYGQVAGKILSGSDATPTASPNLISTNIDFAQGFSGGALSDSAGQLIGVVVSGHDDSGQNVISAISIGYVTKWISDWRDAGQDVTSRSSDWPSATTVKGLVLRYPTGWSVADENRNGDSYFADITPNDPDVPARVSISIQPTGFSGEPLDFAHQQFDNKSDAVIWGAVEYGQIPGVRVLVNQEGARNDVVYLFARGLRIGISLSAGYSVSDTGPQEQRVTALFDAMLRSVSFESATPTD
jgi:hypothetical protein